jgi:RimJ/RimL family protein N-acetyltransferase
MPTLDTERLALRPLIAEDAAHFVDLFEDDWEAVKQTGRMPYPVTESAMRDWIALHASSGTATFLMIRRGRRHHGAFERPGCRVVAEGLL